MKLTEQEITQKKEEVLNELFNRRERAFYSAQDSVKVLHNPNGNSQKVIRNAELFPGTVYTDQSRLPERRWNLFKRKSKTPSRGGFLTYKWDFVFLLGYKLKVSGSFFEIWYDTYTSTYIIIDQFASPVSSNHRTLDSVMTEFVDIIGEENPTIDMRELDRDEEQYLKALAVRNQKVAMRESEEAIRGLLEYTAASRAYLTDILNAKVSEYHKTKMDSRAVKSFWKFWGKFVEIPQSYMSRGLLGAVRKIIGRERVAEFIIGFSMDNRIDVEIWYVRDRYTNTGSYYVFDLAGKDIIGEEIKSIRHAYQIAGEKIALPREILNRIR